MINWLTIIIPKFLSFLSEKINFKIPGVYFSYEVRMTCSFLIKFNNFRLFYSADDRFELPLLDHESNMLPLHKSAIIKLFITYIKILLIFSLVSKLINLYLFIKFSILL